MQEQLLDSLVQAIAEKVMARIRTELSGAGHSPRVQPALFNVKDAAVYLGRSEQAVQHSRCSSLPISLGCAAGNSQPFSGRKSISSRVT
jgi:hypothetical protein